MNVVLACSCDSSSEYSSQEDVVEADETVLLPLRITVLEDAADDDETEEEDMAEPAGEGTQGRRAEPTGLAGYQSRDPHPLLIHIRVRVRREGGSE